MTRYPSELQALIAHLKKLPGVGTKTAERFAFQLLKWSQEELVSLGSLLSDLKNRIHTCEECGCIKHDAGCNFCSSARESHILCILSSERDVFAVEETRSFRGLYHVIGGLLSPLDGRHIEDLRLDKLKERLDRLNVQEVILALDSTLEGDTTALFLKEQLNVWGHATSRLAFGLPIGSSFDYIDGGTLAKALSGRQKF